MKDDDARSGEERPLLAAVEGESGQDAGEAPPIAGQDGGCCVDGKSREPSATDGPRQGHHAHLGMVPSCSASRAASGSLEVFRR